MLVSCDNEWVWRTGIGSTSLMGARADGRIKLDVLWSFLLEVGSKTDYRRGIIGVVRATS